MVSTTFTFSGLMCLFLALAPATVLSAPQLPPMPFPDIIDHGPETTSQGPGNSETSANNGVQVGIPDGPYVNVGTGYHDVTRGPCGPGSGNDHRASAGVNVGIPDGPYVNVGAGEHEHEGGYPCPEPPVLIPTTTPTPVEVIVPPTETVAPPPVATANPPILPPTFTTPISIPTTTAPAIWASAVPIVPTSTPLIHHPAPTASSSPSAPVAPVFNAGSPLAPASLLAVALPFILAFFQ